MAEIKLTGINKIYPDGTHAVHDVDLHIADGEFMIMVGPSGCAKSTILRMIAGLETPTSGSVEIGGRLVNDVPPKDRDIAMVFQSYALYPHMTVRDNMAFGLRLRKMPEHDIAQRVDEAARILGLEHLLDRLPKQMSGGQRQRVAMGRAIVREPQAFLMDEPLSNLDAKLRVQMRTEIAKLHQRLCTTTVYVTHDQVEAMTLGQRICILRKGVVQQVDTPYMVYTNPANIFVGSFIGSPGMNFMSGQLFVHEGSVLLQLGDQALALPRSVTDRFVTGDIDGRPVVVGIRPEHMHEVCPGDGSDHALAADVELTEAMGSEAFAYFRLNVPMPDLSALSDTQATSSTFTAKLPATTSAQAGHPLYLRLELDNLHLFDPQSQLTLLAPLEEQARNASFDAPALPQPHQAPQPTGFAPRPVAAPVAHAAPMDAWPAAAPHAPAAHAAPAAPHGAGMAPEAGCWQVERSAAPAHAIASVFDQPAPQGAPAPARLAPQQAELTAETFPRPAFRAAQHHDPAHGEQRTTGGAAHGGLFSPATEPAAHEPAQQPAIVASVAAGADRAVPADAGIPRLQPPALRPRLFSSRPLFGDTSHGGDAAPREQASRG